MASSRIKRIATPFYRFARWILAVFSAIVYPCKLVNKEGADLPAPFILICNHQSMMDPILLAVKLNQHEIHFIGKREITKFKPLKWIVEHLHMIAISRHASDLAAMRAAGEVLKAGHVLGIFPEGRRVQGPPMEDMESGVSMLALRHRVQLLPVYIKGRPRPFRKVVMTVEPPIQFLDLLEEGLNKSSSEALNHRIQETYRNAAKKT